MSQKLWNKSIWKEPFTFAEKKKDNIAGARRLGTLTRSLWEFCCRYDLLCLPTPTLAPLALVSATLVDLCMKMYKPHWCGCNYRKLDLLCAFPTGLIFSEPEEKHLLSALGEVSFTGF